MLIVRVLGAAAGGGLPQWNCGCPTCQAAREGRIAPQSQSSIALSADGQRWLLLNASPDLRTQIQSAPCLHPRSNPRHSPIHAVVLTNADVDHIGGLLHMRESQPFHLYATHRVHQVLESNSIFRVLEPPYVERHAVQLETPWQPIDISGQSLGMRCRLFSVPGKVARYLEDQEKSNFGTVEEDTVAMEIISDSGRRFYYIPGCAEVHNGLKTRVESADALFFDGTLWDDQEMIRQQLGIKTGKRMGHISMSGETGSLCAWANVAIKRRVFIHINNTNPVWMPESPQRRYVAQAGWDIAHDGMEIEL